MTSSVTYILVALTLMSAMISLTFLLAWRTLGRKAHTMSWSIAFLAATFQWFFSLAVDRFPNHATYWLSVNALGLIVITLSLRGHCQRTGCKHLPKNLWPFSAAILIAIAWTTLANKHVGLTTAILPASVALTLFLSAIMIVRHRAISRPAEVATSITMVLFGVAQLAAAIAAFLQGAGGNAFWREVYLNINFMSLPAGYTGVAILVLFMVASDLSEQMKSLAVSDQLTGLLNRRGFGEQGASAYATARRNNTSVSVIMTDIDRFKAINDKFGHAAGDLALCHFALLLSNDRRRSDVTARVGGEEFALILPGTSLQNAMKIADDLRELVHSTPCNIEGEALQMTASFGVAVLTDKDSCLTDAIVRADTALYRSKREGRNRVDLESSQRMFLLAGGREAGATNS